MWLERSEKSSKLKLMKKARNEENKINENQSLRGLRGRQSHVHVAHVRSTNTWRWGVHSGSFGDFPAEGGLDILLARRVRVDLRQLAVGQGHVGSQ